MIHKALTIAGSDSSGGAGIQADLKTYAAYGVYGASVITSVVAENTLEVLGRYDVPPDAISAQLDAVFADIGADAVKLGMLPMTGCIDAVSDGLKKYRAGNVVSDPVMLASVGTPLMREDTLKIYRDRILPLTDLVTPNLSEAEALSGLPVYTLDQRKDAAKAILGLGAGAVLIKGGHLHEEAQDMLYDGDSFTYFTAKRVGQKDPHGTGCTLSSAIAAGLALGLAMPKAVSLAKEFITGAIVHSLEIGRGRGPTNPLFALGSWKEL